MRDDRATRRYDLPVSLLGDLPTLENEIAGRLVDPDGRAIAARRLGVDANEPESHRHHPMDKENVTNATLGRFNRLVKRYTSS